MKEFRINDHITLRLVKEKVIETRIYIDEEEFLQCNHLFIMNPHENELLKNIKSIDEVSDLLENKIESFIEITPEEEFWGHCANLQAWVENDYDVNIIHTNLAFPLLKKLAEKGVKKAEFKLRDVVIDTIENRNLVKINHFLENGYFKFFSFEEFENLYQTFCRIDSIYTINFEHLPIYLEVFQNFGGFSINYSKSNKCMLGPIERDIRAFLKKAKLKNDTVKEKKIKKILSYRIFVDNKYITLSELLSR